MHTKEIASEANRWGGRNKLGYSNPRVDELQDKLMVSIDEAEQKALHQQIVQIAMGDIAAMPLYWQILPVLALASVKGPVPAGEGATWNIFEWDKR